MEALTASIAALEKTKPPNCPEVQAIVGSRSGRRAFLLFASREHPEQRFGDVAGHHYRDESGRARIFRCRRLSPARKPQDAAGLSELVASEQNPLTARVMVNRIWQHHFGRGLVGTPNDFGHMGERLSNPELLDWLATEFMRSGWSVKAMHRLILISRTYQQAAERSRVRRT